MNPFRSAPVLVMIAGCAPRPPSTPTPSQRLADGGTPAAAEAEAPPSGPSSTPNPSVKPSEARRLLTTPAFNSPSDWTRLSVRGFIVRTNLSEVPLCLVHSTGEADPVGCRGPAPTFWLGDTPTTPIEDALPVMGWASNYAVIFDAIRVFDGTADDLSYPTGEFLDPLWGQVVPNPLPAVGAEVTVYGKYGKAFTLSSSGSQLEPRTGVLTYERLETLVPSSTLATLPSVERAPRAR